MSELKLLLLGRESFRGDEEKNSVLVMNGVVVEVR